ncbi:MAG: BatD family protein [Fibrobacterota bacterium]
MVRTGSLAAILLCAAGAWSAVVGVQAQLGARQVRVGEQIPLIVTVSVDDDGKDLPWPEVKLPAGVTLGSKNRSQSTSEQVSIVNFKMTRQKTTQVQYVLKLSATKSGTYAIGPVSFQGRDLGSGEVKVVDAPQDVRTSTIVGRRSVYVGQQVPFIWRITADRPFDVRKFTDVRPALGNGV